MSENHGVPGSNPGPATLETPELQEKRLRAWTGLSRLRGRLAFAGPALFPERKP